MTRLRLVLKDESGVDDEKIKSIPGVVGVMRKSGQYQIIIGNNVAKCFAEFNKLGNFADESASGAKKAKGKRKINPVSAVLDALSGSDIISTFRANKGNTGWSRIIVMPKNY